MSLFLVFAKVFVSVIMVLGLVFVSERNPRLGGLLAGLPLGTGIMVFFYSIEQTMDFVLKGIPYGIAGLVSALAFGFGFYWGGMCFVHNRFFHVATAFMTGILAFLGVGALIHWFPITLLNSILIFLVGLFLAIAFFRKISVPPGYTPQKLTLAMLAFRIGVVASIVLIITGLAHHIGAQWAGILASFPTVLSPLLILLAYSHKNALYPNVLKHFSYSITTLALFYLLVLGLFPSLGIYYGLIAAYGICFVYLFLLNKAKTRLFPSQAPT